MADFVSLTSQLAGQEKIRIFDHLQLRPDLIASNPTSTVGPGSDGIFSNLIQAPAVVQNPNTNYPRLMDEASRMGGKLRIEEARELGAVLGRFQQSQEARWKEMIDKVNSSATLSPAVARQLELKMGRINSQFGRLNTSLQLPAPEAASFMTSLGLTTEELSKPIKKFFNFIARGERQLYSLQSELSDLYEGNKALSPAALLRLQLKMTHVSQQLELFTNMLNKGLESSKTVFNTQI